MVNTRKNSHVEYLDQVISLSPRDGVVERASGPGLTTLSKLIKKINKENLPPEGWNLSDKL